MTASFLTVVIVNLFIEAEGGDSCSDEAVRSRQC